MNATRRKEIGAIADDLRALHEQLTAIKERIETVHAEEQEYFDNMPESIQCGEKGDKATEAIDTLQEACGELENSEEAAQSVLDALDRIE